MKMKNTLFLVLLLSSAAAYGAADGARTVTYSKMIQDQAKEKLWADGNKAAKLPNKDKVQLDALLAAVNGLDPSVPRENLAEWDQQTVNAFNTALGYLSAQVGRVKRSLSGFMAGIKAPERLQLLHTSLQYIAEQLEMQRRFVSLEMVGGGKTQATLAERGSLTKKATNTIPAFEKSINTLLDEIAKKLAELT